MIKLASPDITEEDISLVKEVILSGNLIEGKISETFTEKLKTFCGQEFCLLFNSGTNALFSALFALGVKRGDYVLVPSFSFPATSNVVEMLGANCIFYDVSISSYVGSIEEIKEAYEQVKDNIFVKGIITVDEFGFPVDMGPIRHFADQHGMFLLEDAACALGSKITSGEHVGTYSDCTIFSFHPRKVITCGEGGALITNNKKLFKKLCAIKNHGLEIVGNQRHFSDIGLNFRLTDFQVAMLLGQLNRFGTSLKIRTSLANSYFEKLQSCSAIKLPQKAKGHNWQTFMALFKDRDTRNLIQKKLNRDGIETNIGAQCIPNTNFAKRKYNLPIHLYKNSLHLYECGLALPLHSNVKLDEVSFICKKLLSYNET